MPGWRDESSHNSRRRVPEKRLKRDASQVGAKFFVPILYLVHDFGAFGDFSDFVESISCEISESCQVRGSNPCRGAILKVWVLKLLSLRPLLHLQSSNAPMFGTVHEGSLQTKHCPVNRQFQEITLFP